MAIQVDQARVRQLVGLIESNMSKAAKVKPALRVVSAEPQPEVDISPRGIKIRAIEALAAPHPWGRMAIRQYLDAKRVPYPSDLTDGQLEELESRIERFADMESCGHYQPDSPAF